MMCLRRTPMVAAFTTDGMSISCQKDGCDRHQRAPATFAGDTERDEWCTVPSILPRRQQSETGGRFTLRRSPTHALQGVNKSTAAC